MPRASRRVYLLGPSACVIVTKHADSLDIWLTKLGGHLSRPPNKSLPVKQDEKIIVAVDEHGLQLALLHLSRVSVPGVGNG